MQSITIANLLLALLLAASTAFAGLGQPVELPLGIVLALTFIPADTLQSALIKRIDPDRRNNA